MNVKVKIMIQNVFVDMVVLGHWFLNGKDKDVRLVKTFVILRGKSVHFAM